MKLRFCILGLLLATDLGRAQDSASLDRLPFQRWVEVKGDSGKASFFEPPKTNAIANKWSLSGQNITTEITEAYRYNDNIVVFGWSGNAVGVVTLIDASAGNEKLQLLVNERNRFITGNGKLLYGHWFVKGAYEPDDSVWLLNLNNPLPLPASKLPNGVVVEIGKQVYPGSDGKPIRHSIRDLLLGANGEEMFLTDWPITATGSTQMCFVRIESIQLDQTKTKLNCVDETKLTGHAPGDVQGSRLEFDQNGDLGLSLTFVHDPTAVEYFVVDPVTLKFATASHTRHPPRSTAP